MIINTGENYGVMMMVTVILMQTAIETALTRIIVKNNTTEMVATLAILGTSLITQ